MAFLAAAPLLILIEVVFGVFVDMRYVVSCLSYAFIFGILTVFTPRKPKELEVWPRCTNCGYNLTGNVSGICPECGTPVETE